ncbi:4-hydroxythreonine-4-phosphate dehydrogenase PdxA [Clostridium formicaceticum]|uniref:Putative D-threonate 4-phosphate dehydrogenase n=1 Tax=Clostridium formicaceticum TaxID=1497 RepID=A0AAC9RGV7_9CLOT|nr:4-hydroxythreonine-4-phosphate dehydrogenase PdxA [Clostridium formicaceticum]AOY76287.1 4-hydroxythreonine-4-phosphate dehydrogenase PdxA [Clostridium formicaceticum]ARE86674.1 4-hydroxythreonine-4-phosphate dehydrogenase 2 [Clostridium formicaceticum]
MKVPVIGIPMGDPAGIGPEIVVKALAVEEIHKLCKVVVIGDKATLLQAMDICNVNLEIKVISQVEEGDYKEGILNLIDLQNVAIEKLKFGEVQAMAGKAAFDYIKKSVDLAKAGNIDVLATTPINKEALKAAKIDYIGHTEILADLTNTNDPLTMFEVDQLRVFFLSRHVSLREACDLVKKERVLDYIERSYAALERLGIDGAKLAVAGLNPHSGENGLFGREEVDEINFAIEVARQKGIDVVGPVPADSVFHFGLKGSFDAVLSLYHDQGHIATKMVDFERTISLTNNMPFLRTSVDHGTAFDIAGTGKASAVSMIEAIKVGAKYGPYFKR